MMEEHNYYVYILTRERNSGFYVGMTHDLLSRVYAHKEELVEGFTKKYNVTRLVYYEVLGNMSEALYREKIIKNWKRTYKREY